MGDVNEIALTWLNRPVPQWRVGVMVLLGGLACFSAGRFSAPVEVETITEFKTLKKEVVVEKWRQAKDRKVDTEKTTLPNGTIIEKSTEREITKAEGSSDSKKEEDTQKLDKKTTTLRADWRIGVQAGASLREPALPITGPLVLGVTVERRIIGGVSLGIWANTVGAAGGSVSLEF